MVRIYDIPDHTFESDDEDESSSDEEEDSESEGMPSWITGSQDFSFYKPLTLTVHFCLIVARCVQRST